MALHNLIRTMPKLKLILFRTYIPKNQYDAIIIGAGHNGLTAAAYLQKNGLNVCVFERRHVIGGAAVTEELIPGFKFSRCSYVLSLLRPQIINDLELKKHGLKLYLRDPYAYVPLWKQSAKNQGSPSLTLGMNSKENKKQISQFSHKDAEAFGEYEKFLNGFINIIEPLLDNSAPDFRLLFTGKMHEKLKTLSSFKALIKILKGMGKDLPLFYQFITSPAANILNKWFESDILKGILATDSVIGAMQGPFTPGSAYVLLHHVMGQAEGIKGAWGYVEGGMGGVSTAISKAAESYGTKIFTDTEVAQILLDSSKIACGVQLLNGTKVKSKIVLSNATPKITFFNLLPHDSLPKDFLKEIKGIDYTSPVTKINVALKELPNFLSNPYDSAKSLYHHHASIHINSTSMELIQQSCDEALQGDISHNPMLEITIPSTLDLTLAPKNCHVMSIFSQFTPYTLSEGRQWDEKVKNNYADHVFNIIEDYAPGFKTSVIGKDILSPPDLERIFGLTGGNIFHGSMSLNQLYFSRPNSSYPGNRTPIPRLYLCGSGVHPGGGVMGSCGRLAAVAALQDYPKIKS